MVLPLIIGVGVLAVGAVAFSGGFSGIGSALDRWSKSDDRKKFELEQEKHEFQKSKRGLLENAYAFIFGETETRKVSHPNQADPQAPLTGQKNETPQRYRSGLTFNFPDVTKELRNG